ncbi:MAG: mucoidy inhibitor MuiA family protein [Pseudomonadota bacterium]
MKLGYLGFAGLWLATIAQAQVVDSQIDAVTVYPFGANVTRVAEVDLAAGTHQLTLTDLPGGLDTSLVRAAVAGTGARLADVAFSEDQIERTEDAEEVRLRGELLQVRDELAAEADRAKTAELQLQFLKSLSADREGEPNRAAASLATTIAALGEASTSAYRTIRDSQQAQRTLEERADRLERELKNAGIGSLAYTHVTLSLEVVAAGTQTVSVTYFQPGASWRSEYEGRLDSVTPRLSLKQLAKVRQNTSEDWTDVALTLATNRVNARLEAPEVVGQFLELAEPRPPVAASTAMQLDEIVVTAAADPRQSFEQAFATIDLVNYAANYQIPGRVTLANNRSDERSFELDETLATPTLITTVVPRQSGEAFLTARFGYRGLTWLAPGNLSLFVDGNYAGKLRSPAMLPGKEVVLPFGQDPLVEVKVADQGGSAGRGGIVRRRQEQATDFLFTLTNRRRAPTDVEVLDLIPQAVNRAIEVEVPKTATPPSQSGLDDRPGVVAWRRTLAPGEAWQIRHQYEVSYPADQRLVQRRGR